MMQHAVNLNEVELFCRACHGPVFSKTNHSTIATIFNIATSDSIILSIIYAYLRSSGTWFNHITFSSCIQEKFITHVKLSTNKLNQEFFFQEKNKIKYLDAIARIIEIECD